MSHTLVQIGNSKAIIIPARMIKRKNYDSNTNDGFRIVHKHPSLESLEFPKAENPMISSKIKGLKGVAKFSADEIEQDERLKYILER